jgi:homospermidine synthase
MNIAIQAAWKEFRSSGLLWWVNRSLHLFGWAIAYTIDEKDNIISVLPMRVLYRGFSRADEEEGFTVLTKYMKESSGSLFMKDLAQTSEPAPVDLILFCPNCDLQHIDAPKGEWSNPPHRTHECQRCGYYWRPADIETNGVKDIRTKGSFDGRFKREIPLERD